MLPLVLMNVITGLVSDKPRFVKDHVSKMIDDVIPENPALDQMLSRSNSTPQSLTEMLSLV